MVRPLVFLIGIFILIGVFARAAFAAATYSPFMKSIELSVSTAEDVVFAHIVRVEKSPVPPKTWPGSDPRWKVTIRVDDSILGAPRGTDLVFWENVIGEGNVVPTTTPQFFVLTRDPIPAGLLSREFLTWETATTDNDLMLPDKLNDIPNLALRHFKGRSELLDAIRPYCIRPLAHCPQEIFYAPESGWLFDFLIPVDTRSEQLAEGWIQSADPDLRWSGARVLRWRKTPRNISLIQKIADTWPRHDADETARAISIQALAAWGVPNSSTMRFPTASFGEVFGIWFWISLLILIAVPMSYWRWSGRTKKESRFWRRAVMLWLIGVTAIGVLWGRSYLELDGACWGGWQVGLLHGQLIGVQRDGWDSGWEWPLEYCRPGQFRELAGRESLWEKQGFVEGVWEAYAFADNSPTVLDGNTYRVSLLLIEAIFGIPVLFVQGGRGWVHWKRLRRARRMRGFPVTISQES